MMKKREDGRKRLEIKREQLRQLAELSADQMAQVAGGTPWRAGRGQSKGCY